MEIKYKLAYSRQNGSEAILVAKDEEGKNITLIRALYFTDLLEPARIIDVDRLFCDDYGISLEIRVFEGCKDVFIRDYGEYFNIDDIKFLPVDNSDLARLDGLSKMGAFAFDKSQSLVMGEFDKYKCSDIEDCRTQALILATYDHNFPLNMAGYLQDDCGIEPSEFKKRLKEQELLLDEG